jgi:hypothetical protein
MIRNPFGPAPVALALASSLIAWAGASAAEEKPDVVPTTVLERMHVKNEKCHWTDEMGKYMFDCLKANFNMNAHWCHNEAMELFCPAQRESGSASEPGPGTD